jgi:OmpA-OmpF porin, OOP family
MVRATNAREGCWTALGGPLSGLATALRWALTSGPAWGLAWGLTTSIALPVAAQEATALPRFQPSVPGDPWVGLPGAGVEGTVRVSTGLLLDYANEPLVLATRDGDETVRSVVAHQASMRAQIALALWERLLLHVDLPATVFASGESAAAAAGSDVFAEPAAASLQDLRVGARLELLEAAGLAPSASLGFHLFAPTGDDGSYASTGEVRATPYLVLGATWGPVSWSTFVARAFAPAPSRTEETGLVGSELTFGGGVSGRVDRFRVGAESLVSASVRSDPLLSTRPVHAELLATGQADLGPLTFSLGGGPGLTRAPGTPRFRVLAGVTATFDVVDRAAHDAPRARLDERQASPPSPAPARVDELALLARVAAEQRDRVQETDSDGDEIPDRADGCPTRKGPRREDPATHGCPGDGDGDGLFDDEDACPDRAGPRSTDATKRGCPGSVRVEEGRLALLAPVLFETGSAKLRSESLPLLEEIAEILRSDPTILRVAVDGHTDSRGLPRKNLELSRARAVAVVRWLNEHGVEALRTEARGFGARAPITTNGTEEGRLANRRVEIVILERKTRAGGSK